MKKMLGVVLLVVGGSLVLAGAASSIEYCGVDFPEGASSFADCVVSYDQGDPDCDNTSNVTGVPECSGATCDIAVNLKYQGGEMVVGFMDNFLTTSGNSDKDLWIFEVGSGIEQTDVEISQDNENWISVGRVEHGINGIDIDAFIGSGVVLGEAYSYVKLIDVGNTPSAEGADINAVGASSSIPQPAWRVCPQSAQASTMCGHEMAYKSNVINLLSILLAPMGAILLLRIWRRKR